MMIMNGRSYKVTYNRINPEDLLKRLRMGSPLSQSEYGFLIDNGYLPNDTFGSMTNGATVSPKELSASGMFERNRARSNGGLFGRVGLGGNVAVRYGM